MNYTNQMKIKFERKEDALKALTVIKQAFIEGDFYDEYKNDVLEKVLNDLSVNDTVIEIGDGFEGYFIPEDSRRVFEMVFTTLASTLTLINFEAEAKNLGNYSSSRITAQFNNGSFALQNEYWDIINEDGDSDLRIVNHYFF